MSSIRINNNWNYQKAANYTRTVALNTNNNISWPPPSRMTESYQVRLFIHNCLTGTFTSYNKTCNISYCSGATIFNLRVLIWYAVMLTLCQWPILVAYYLLQLSLLLCHLWYILLCRVVWYIFWVLVFCMPRNPRVILPCAFILALTCAVPSGFICWLLAWILGCWGYRWIFPTDTQGATALITSLVYVCCTS